MRRAHNQAVDHRSELLRAFRMTSDDLEANRMGHLGRGQARMLLRSGYTNLVGATVLAGVVLAILLLVAERPLKPVQVILSGLLIVAVVALGVVMLVRSRAAAADGEVECLAGPVIVHLQRQAGWYLYVADRRLKLPVSFRYVHNEAPYRVYIASKASRIVAMEPDGWA
jgi:hypothetical protein